MPARHPRLRAVINALALHKVASILAAKKLYMILLDWRVSICAREIFLEDVLEEQEKKLADAILHLVLYRADSPSR